MKYFEKSFLLISNSISLWGTLFLVVFVGCPDILANQNVIKNFISSTPDISKIKITKTIFNNLKEDEIGLVSTTFEAAWKEGSFIINGLSVEDTGLKDSFGRYQGKYWFYDGLSQTLRVYMDNAKGSLNGLEPTTSGVFIGEKDLFSALLLGILGATPGNLYWDEVSFKSTEGKELGGGISSFENDLVTGIIHAFQGLVVELKYEYDLGLEISGSPFPNKILQYMKTPDEEVLGHVEYEIKNLVLWNEENLGPELNPELVYQDFKIIWESSKGTKYKNAGTDEVFELGVGDPGKSNVWVILGIAGPALLVLVAIVAVLKKRNSSRHHGQSATT